MKMEHFVGFHQLTLMLSNLTREILFIIFYDENQLGSQVK